MYALASTLNSVQQWMEAGGCLVLFLALFSCGLGVPLPEDIPLLVAGFFVAQGKMHLVVAAVVAWCGIIGGDCVLYHLGKKFGLNVTRLPLIGRHVTKERIQRAEKLFERYGIWVVAVGRLFAGVRAGMVIAAGTTRFNFIKFLIADGLAAIVSGGLFLFLGWLAGRTMGDLNKLQANIHRYENYLLAGAAVVAILIGLYVWWRRKRHKALGDAALEKIAELPPDAPAAE